MMGDAPDRKDRRPGTSKDHLPLPARGTLWSILHLRCPRCHHGKVFRGLVTMNPRCGTCGLRFEREQGYFLGAMYVSYAFASIIIGLGVLLFYTIVPEWSDIWIFAAATLLLLPFVPFIFRYSRVIWMAFDRTLDE